MTVHTTLSGWTTVQQHPKFGRIASAQFNLTISFSVSILTLFGLVLAFLNLIVLKFANLPAGG